MRAGAEDRGKRGSLGGRGAEGVSGGVSPPSVWSEAGQLFFRWYVGSRVGAG